MRTPLRKALCIGGCTALLALAAGWLASAAAPALAAFTWSGAGADDDWDNCENWVPDNDPCSTYPDDTGDDAVIPEAGSPWTVNLVTESIGALTINGDTDFTGDDLTTTSVTFSAGDSGLTVTFDEGTFVCDGC